MKIIKYFFEAVIIYTFFLIIKIIGLHLSRKLFSKIFNLVGPIVKSKEVVDSNIEKVYGDCGELKKNKIISSMWSNYGKTFVEYIFLNHFKKNNSHIKIKGLEILNEIKKKNKPVIFVSGHFANYELMSMELVRANIRLATIYRPLNNFFLNPLMEYLRRKNVCENQIKKGLPGTREVIKYLKNNYSVALMIDQRVSEGKSLPFFEKKALTTTLPAQISLKFNYEIVPIYLERTKDNSFEMEVMKPISTNNTENSDINKLGISLKLNKIIENMILKNPNQWIWTHNRWK